jgi:hypothetical protein
VKISGKKRQDDPKGIGQYVTDRKGPVGDKGLMDFIGKPVQYADKAKNKVDTQGIIKGRVPWVGGKHEGEAEEEIGGGMEQEIIKGEKGKRKLYLFQGRDIEDGRCEKEGGECVNCLSHYLDPLKGKEP